MTEEEQEKAQEQLKALSQAYNELSQHCSDHNSSAEEVGLVAFSSIVFSFKKWRHLMVSCMTNSFPSVQRELVCHCFLLPRTKSEQETFKQLRKIGVCCKHAFPCPPLA